MIRVAIAYNKNTGEIFEHFGHCEMFAVYEYGDTLDDCKKKAYRLLRQAWTQGHGRFDEGRECYGRDEWQHGT